MTEKFDGWRKILLDQIDSKLTTRTRRSVGINFPVELHALLMRAARQRGMSMAAYTRRAALAFAIRDLELDYDMVMKDEPAVREFGEGMSLGDKLSGKGYGRWKIEALEGDRVAAAGRRTEDQG